MDIIDPSARLPDKTNASPALEKLRFLSKINPSYLSHIYF